MKAQPRAQISRGNRTPFSHSSPSPRHQMPFYCTAGFFSRFACGELSCHNLWSDAIYRLALGPYGVPKGKLMAPSEREASLLASDIGREKNAFLWPRMSGASASNPLGDPMGPEPLAIFTLVTPAGVGWENGLNAINKWATEAQAGPDTSDLDAEVVSDLMNAVLARSTSSGVVPGDTDMSERDGYPPHCDASLPHPPPQSRGCAPRGAPARSIRPCTSRRQTHRRTSSDRDT